ncbi:hypothetical protein [Bacillus cereus]|uniref:hypothetical protein n=1 Tax=Bacillus cereus TaxID=1396 RepID=UPI0027E1B2DB|nr:hypothetical protein [Bacillus cereus]
MLGKEAIPIGQFDKFRTSLRQFCEMQYINETYLINWHPIYNEFVGSHESETWISHTDLHKFVWIKNFKVAFLGIS